MKKNETRTDGLENLIAHYRRAFHLAENIEYYSKPDFKSAERQFIKFMHQNRELSQRCQAGCSGAKNVKSCWREPLDQVSLN